MASTPRAGRPRSAGASAHANPATTSGYAALSPGAAMEALLRANSRSPALRSSGVADAVTACPQLVQRVGGHLRAGHRRIVDRSSFTSAAKPATACSCRSGALGQRCGPTPGRSPSGQRRRGGPARQRQCPSPGPRGPPGVVGVALAGLAGPVGRLAAPRGAVEGCGTRPRDALPAPPARHGVT